MAEEDPNRGKSAVTFKKGTEGQSASAAECPPGDPSRVRAPDSWLLGATGVTKPVKVQRVLKKRLPDAPLRTPLARLASRPLFTNSGAQGLRAPRRDSLGRRA